MDSTDPAGAATIRVPPSRSPRRAVGVLRLGAFFLFLALLTAALNSAINHGLRKITTSKFGTLNRIVDGKINAEILVSGSSRALNHYDTRILQRATGLTAYNIGMNASQIDFELAVFKTYLRHNQPPKILIQNLDLFSFETTHKGQIYDPGYLIPYLREPDLYGTLSKVDPVVWKWKNLPLYGYAVEDLRFTWATGLLALGGFQPREDYFQGFNPRYQSWGTEFARFQNANAAGVHRAIEPDGVMALQELIGLCKNRGIRAALVYSPEYFEMQSLERNRAEVFEKFREICAGAGVPLWDYSGSLISHERSFFYNSQHLNAQGAEMFTEDLAKRLLAERPFWGQKAP